MDQRVRVGIIGLGRRWRRSYGPALAALRDRYRVTAVCDPLRRRADAEARRWGCTAAAGPVALLERGDVEALILADAPWFGLWPVEMACRLGKPVLCAPSLGRDGAHADALLRQGREARARVLMALTPRLAPATGRLRELLATELGQPRVLACAFIHPAPPVRGDREDAAGLLGAAGVALVDWCTWLLGAAPLAVVGAGLEGGTLSQLLLECAAGQGIQVTRLHAPGTRWAVRLHVAAVRGSATVELPDRVAWSSPGGEQAQRLRGQPSATRRLLEQFVQVVRGVVQPEPSLEDAGRALGWLRAAAHSRAEGQRLPLDG